MPAQTMTPATKQQPTALTQEQLMAEAAITEEWNKADYEAYIRYTELTDKEKASFLSVGKNRRTKASRFSHTLISRSFIDQQSQTSKSEILIHPPPITDEEIKKEKLSVPRKRTTAELLGIDAPPSHPIRTGYLYRHPTSLEGFNTSVEFSAINDREDAKEKGEISKIIHNLNSLLVKAADGGR